MKFLKMKLLRRYFIWTILFCPLLAIGADATKSPPALSRATLSSKDFRYEIKVDALERKVDVYMLQSSGPSPEKISLILTTEAGSGPTVGLQPVNLVGQTTPHYRAQLPDSHMAYVGVVLKIDFEGGKSKSLRGRLHGHQ